MSLHINHRCPTRGKQVSDRTKKGQPNQYLTFLVSGNGGGAITLEVSPLVSSASESDVGLTHEISTTPASAAQT